VLAYARRSLPLGVTVGALLAVILAMMYAPVVFGGKSLQAPL
jgi:hypothetical protein